MLKGLDFPGKNEEYNLAAVNVRGTGLHFSADLPDNSSIPYVPGEQKIKSGRKVDTRTSGMRASLRLTRLENPEILTYLDYTFSFNVDYLTLAEMFGFSDSLLFQFHVRIYSDTFATARYPTVLEVDFGKYAFKRLVQWIAPETSYRHSFARFMTSHLLTNHGLKETLQGKIVLRVQQDSDPSSYYTAYDASLQVFGRTYTVEIGVAFPNGQQGDEEEATSEPQSLGTPTVPPIPPPLPLMSDDSDASDLSSSFELLTRPGESHR